MSGRASVGGWGVKCPPSVPPGGPPSATGPGQGHELQGYRFRYKVYTSHQLSDRCRAHGHLCLAAFEGPRLTTVAIASSMSTWAPQVLACATLDIW
jgi:hypothetical protein